VTRSESELSGSTTELPPIDNRGRLTVPNTGSRSTTPSYADSRGSSRRSFTNSPNKTQAHVSLKTPSYGPPGERLGSVRGEEVGVGRSEGVGENTSAGADVASMSHTDKVIYPVRTKTSEQLR